MRLETLAHLLGVTRKTLYNWERSGEIPQPAVDRMAVIFPVPADYLLEEAQEPK